MNELINKLFNAGIKSLQEKQNLFNQIQSNPELIITDLFNPKLSQPFYEFPIQIFGKDKELIGTQFHYHDMQKYLLELIKDYFSTFNTNIVVELVEPSKYSSGFVIKFNDYKILNFDIYHHEFNVIKEVDIEKLSHRINRTEEQINKNVDNIIEWKGYKDNIWSMCKNYKDYIWVFKNKKDVYKNIEEMIKRFERAFQFETETLKNDEDILCEYQKVEKELDSATNYWVSKFVNWGYKQGETRAYCI